MSLAYAAAQRTRHIPSGSDERQATAHAAIIEHLQAASRRPYPEALVRTAVRAILLRYQSGLSDDHGCAGDRTAPATLTYWLTPGTHPYEEHVVDVIALTQTWAMLTAEQQAILAAVAEHRYVTRAAEALGISTAEATQRLQHAQDRFARLWEQPGRPHWHTVHPPGRAGQT